MEAVVFDRVTKVFRIGRPSGVKDAVLGRKMYKGRLRSIVAVNEVTFSVREGETVALLGHNGSGKSTCLKLLAGTIAPSLGNVATFGRLAPLLELGAGFHPELTGRENVYLNAAVLGVRRKYIKQHLDEIVAFSGLEAFIDTPVRLYSSGMTARLGFSVAVHVEPEIVLLDEVLAVGDAGFQARGLARMRQLRDEGRTIVLVTHSLAQAQDFCSRALVMHQGRLSYDGPMEGADDAFRGSTQAPSN